MSLFDHWVARVARKDFSKTINWIEAFIVALLAGLLATFIYLDMKDIEISIPVMIVDSRRFSVSQDYLTALPKSTTAVLISSSRAMAYPILKKEINRTGRVIFVSSARMPQDNRGYRLLITRRSVLSMLLKTRSFTD